MKLFKILFAALNCFNDDQQTWSAVDYNIKYSSNYVMPAYVHFKAVVHSIQSMQKINIPFIQHCVYFSWFTNCESI